MSNLTQNERAAPDALVSRLRAQYGDRLERVTLFGSKACGDSHPESDLDVLIVVDDGDWRFRDAVALAAFEPMLEYGVVLSPLVVDVSDYLWWQQHRAPIYRNVSAEGIDLWNKKPSSSSTSV